MYWAGGTSFLHLLTTDAHVIETAGRYLGWAVLIPLAGMAAFVWDGIFIGVTATKGMFVSCMVAAVIFFAVYFLLRHVLGNHALWVALLSYLAMRGVVQSCLKIR